MEEPLVCDSTKEAAIDFNAERERSLTRVQQELAGWPALLKRPWRQMEEGSRTGVDQSFRVLTFNMLADSKQGEEQWEVTPPEALEWNSRRWRLLEEMLIHDADIICMQEFDHFDDFFMPELARLGYSGVIRRHSAPAEDSVAVIFRKSRFTLCIEDTSLDYAAVAYLEDTRTMARILIASMHLKPGKDATSEMMRAEQAQALLDLATTVIGKGLTGEEEAPTSPVVLIAGDLNAEPRVAEKIGEPLAYRAIRSHALGLSSAYASMPGALPMDGGWLEPPYTTWKRRPKGEVKRTIDFIFYTGSLHLQSLLALPQEQEMPDERVPTFVYPSDHFSLAVDICLRLRASN